MSRLLGPLVAAVGMMLVGCGGSSPDRSGNSSAASNSNSVSSSSSSVAAAISHNAGQNCMTSGCHASGGNGPTFTVAGTVYRSGGSSPLAQATVKLYRPGTNEVLLQLVSDSLGNFYSQQAVDGLNDGTSTTYDGVDPEVNGISMPGVITTGACSACHGSSNGKITAN